MRYFVEFEFVAKFTRSVHPRLRSLKLRLFQMQSWSLTLVVLSVGRLCDPRAVSGARTARGWQGRTTDEEEEDAIKRLVQASCCREYRVVSWNRTKSAKLQNW